MCVCVKRENVFVCGNARKNKKVAKERGGKQKTLKQNQLVGCRGQLAAMIQTGLRSVAEPGHLAIPQSGRTGWQLMKVLPTPAKDRDAKFAAKARQLESQEKNNNSHLQSQPKLGWSKEG